MKRFFLSIAVTILAMGLSAQTVNVHFKNGQTVQFNSDNVDYVDFSLKAPEPSLTAGQVVDLGLSVYWASCNLGADSPEDSGNLYAWGETTPKSQYNQNNYSYYNSNTKEYIDIGDNIAGTEYDAATVNLGYDWRMPTNDEFNELLTKCSIVWSKINGKEGCILTGPNGNSIFLPLTSSEMRYWTAEIGQVFWATYASRPNPYLDSRGMKSYRYTAAGIRPVTSNLNAGGTPTDHSSDYQVTDKISASFAGGAYSSMNGLISSGSQLMWRFTNNSTETVLLTGIQLINGVTGAESTNMLSENVEVAAGETKGYTVTVGLAGIQKPKIRFTYRYNQKNYTVEASMPD